MRPITMDECIAAIGPVGGVEPRRMTSNLFKYQLTDDYRIVVNWGWEGSDQILVRLRRGTFYTASESMVVPVCVRAVEDAIYDCHSAYLRGDR